jgi:hypothetical protein
MLIGMLIFGLIAFAFHDKMPFIMQAIFAGLISLCIFGCVAGLCSIQPVISIDEDGLHYRKMFMKKIPWNDIAAVRRMPRQQKMDDGSTQFSLTDSTRPVNVFVTNIENYVAPYFAWILRRTVSSEIPNSVCLQIDCMGTTAKSEELHACLSHYIKNNS